MTTTERRERDQAASQAVPSKVGGQAVIAREDEKFDMPAMAARMWAPMLAMGVMAVATAIVAGVVQASDDGLSDVDFAQIGAWKSGFSFLGVGLLLSSITLMLARILGELRDGGTKVQQALGARAVMLKRPWTGYLFPALMMMGLMVLIGALVLGIVQANLLDSDPQTAADIGAWLAPVRFAGVLMIFSAIVFALATIAKALRLQGDRIRELVSR